MKRSTWRLSGISSAARKPQTLFLTKLILHSRRLPLIRKSILATQRTRAGASWKSSRIPWSFRKRTTSFLSSRWLMPSAVSVIGEGESEFSSEVRLTMSKRLKPIPKFASEAEERAFWELPGNDSTDHADWSKATLETFPKLKPSTGRRESPHSNRTPGLRIRIASRGEWFLIRFSFAGSRALAARPDSPLSHLQSTASPQSVTVHWVWHGTCLLNELLQAPFEGLRHGGGAWKFASYACSTKGRAVFSVRVFV